MRIRRLTIQHFRGIESAELTFNDHNLLIGPNKVGKSTVLSASNLLLGRGRLQVAETGRQSLLFWTSEDAGRAEARELPALRALARRRYGPSSMRARRSDIV
jgi:predicted ATP-dependent endonuclease of OLD family